MTHAEIIEWMDAHSQDLFLSAVTIAEIADGIAKAKREGAKRKALDLSAWLRTVLHLSADRVLPFDTATAEIAGLLADLPAAVVILRALQTSRLLQRPVATA